MNTNDFIKQNIGKTVILNKKRDLAFNGELKPLIYKKTPLKIVKLTKGGLAYLCDEKTKKYYTVPPLNIDLVDDGVNIVFTGESFEIMDGILFETGTKSWLPTEIWENIKNDESMTGWEKIEK